MCASTSKSPFAKSRTNYDCCYIYSKETIKTLSKPQFPNWEDTFVYLRNSWSRHFKTIFNKPNIKYWDLAFEKYRSKYKNLYTNKCKRPRIKKTEQIYTFQEIRRTSSHSSSFSPNDQEIEFFDSNPISNKNFKYCKQNCCLCSISTDNRKKYNPYDTKNCSPNRKKHCICIRNKDTGEIKIIDEENPIDEMTKNCRKSHKLYNNIIDLNCSSPNRSRNTQSFSDIISERSFQYNSDKNIRHSLNKSDTSVVTNRCCSADKSSTDSNSERCCRPNPLRSKCKNTDSSEITYHFTTNQCGNEGQCCARNTGGGSTKPYSGTSEYSNDSDKSYRDNSAASYFESERFRPSRYDNRKSEQYKLYNNPKASRYLTDSMFTDSNRKSGQSKRGTSYSYNSNKPNDPRYTTTSLGTYRKSGQSRYTAGNFDNSRKSGLSRYTAGTVDDSRKSRNNTFLDNNRKSEHSRVSQYSTDDDDFLEDSRTSSVANTRQSKMSRNSRNSQYITDNDNRKSFKMSTNERVRLSTPESSSCSESSDSGECMKSFISFEQVCSCLDKLNRKCLRSPKNTRCCCGKENRIRNCKCKRNPARSKIEENFQEEYDFDQLRQKRNSRNYSRSSNVRNSYTPRSREAYVKYTESNSSNESCVSECKRNFINFQKICAGVDKCAKQRKYIKCPPLHKSKCTTDTQSSCEKPVTYKKKKCRNATDCEIDFIFEEGNKSCTSQNSGDCNDFYSTPSTSLEFKINCAKALRECNKNNSVPCSEPEKNISKCAQEDESLLTCISSSLKSCRQSILNCASNSIRCENQNQIKCKSSRSKCGGRISNLPSCKSSRSNCGRINNHPSCKSSTESYCTRRENTPSCKSSTHGCCCRRIETCGRKKCPFNQDCVAVSKNCDSENVRKYSPRPSCKSRKKNRSRTCKNSPSTNSVSTCRQPRKCTESDFQKIRQYFITPEYDSSTDICCGKKKCPLLLKNLHNMKRSKNSYRENFEDNPNENNRYQRNSDVSMYSENEELDYVDENNEPRIFFRPEQENNNRKKKSKCILTRAKQRCLAEKKKLLKCTESTCKSLKDELINIKNNLRRISRTNCPQPEEQDIECKEECCSSCCINCSEERTDQNLPCRTEHTYSKAHEILQKFRDLINPSKNKPPSPLCLHSSKSVPELQEGVCLCPSSAIDGRALSPNLISELSDEKVCSEVPSNFTSLERCCSKPNCPYWQDTEPDSCTANSNAKLNFSVYTHTQNSLLNNSISFPRPDELCNNKSCPLRKEPIFIISNSEPPSSTVINKGNSRKSRCKNKGVTRTKIQNNEKETLTDTEDCSCIKKLYKGEVIVYTSSVHANEPKLNPTCPANSIQYCQRSTTKTSCNAKTVHFSGNSLVHCIPANDDAKPLCYVVSAGNESEKVRKISNRSPSSNLLSQCKELLFPQKNTALETVTPRRRWLKDMIESIPPKMYGDIPDLQFKFVPPLYPKKCHVIKMKNLCNI